MNALERDSSDTSDAKQAGTQAQRMAQLSVLRDRCAISDVVHRYAAGIDSRDWDSYRSCFSDEVEMDFSSWSNVPGSKMAADQWVRGVSSGLSGFDATHHLCANHVIEVDGDRARCTSYLQATHTLDGETWALGGHYDNDLLRTAEGWKIERCKLTITWSSGPPELFARAAERYANAAG